MTFESMDDFSPAAIARKVEPLRKLLETRTQLSNLMTYMDGKSGAEDLVGKMLRDPTLLQTLGSAPNPKPWRCGAASNEPAAIDRQPSDDTGSRPATEATDKENLDSLLDQMK